MKNKKLNLKQINELKLLKKELNKCSKEGVIDTFLCHIYEIKYWHLINKKLIPIQKDFEKIIVK